MEKKTTINILIRSSKILFLSIYAILVLGASYLLYQSYNNYSYIENLTIESITKEDVLGDKRRRLEEQRSAILLSVLLLLLTLFMFSRRKYLIKYFEIEKENLEILLEDIEKYSGRDKVKEFKTIIENKSSSEIYSLMSEMIEELQESKYMADAANKTKSLFLANMSHELRTPLNGIVGFTKFLKSTNLDGEQDEFVNIIRKSSEDLLSIINDILDISKIENGNFELEEVFFNPMDEFENVIESYAANASKKDIDFSLWIDPSFSNILLRSDPVKIKQVLINLISNAVKFTSNRGVIDVMIEDVGSNENSVSIKFSVKDSGIGISDEQKEKVFEAFTQADSSTSRNFGGTGLGLTISVGLVKLLGGGTLDLESRVGEGSTFSFVLRMPKKEIKREAKYQDMKVAIYSPLDVQWKDSDSYLEEYLLSFRHISMKRFKDLKECLDGAELSFDTLYVHYDKINEDELKNISLRYSRYSNIILITKLNRRVAVQEISSSFSQVIYEPITLSKIEKSFNIVNKEKEIVKDKSDVVKSSSQNGQTMFKGLHALVVEDNPINQKMIYHTLKNLGITSTGANNGKEGLDMYMKNSNYDVILMDIQMPVMNGLDATKAILKYEKERGLKHTPIIAVTANALKGDREKFMEEGMDEYVSKPINLEKFIVALKVFFSSSNELSLLKKNSKKDILLYKETITEAKIISAILNKLDYTVDIVDDIEALKSIIDIDSYKCVLLDRVHSDITHDSLTKYLNRSKIPTLLFTDSKLGITSSDKKNYTFVTDKLADYMSIKEKVDYMIGLDKAS